jgi:uncharacterized coiled-coil protein SlyX
MAQSRPEEEISLRKVMELKLQLLEKALGKQIERLEISQNKVFNKLGKDVSEQNQQIGRLENKLDRVTDLLLKLHGAQASGIDAGREGEDDLASWLEGEISTHFTNQSDQPEPNHSSR